MADDSETPVMEKEVHIIVQVTVRKGEPLPEEMPHPQSAGFGDQGEEDGEPEPPAEEEPAAPKPTLEELGVKFVLSTFNGQSLERSCSLSLVFSASGVLYCSP
jgi:hypothetical protein